MQSAKPKQNHNQQLINSHVQEFLYKGGTIKVIPTPPQAPSKKVGEGSITSYLGF